MQQKKTKKQKEPVNNWVSTRFTEESAERIRYICEEVGMNQSSFIRKACDHYYQVLAKKLL